ncbi:MAG: ABC transporter permease [Stappiaceae bacterium]
MGGLSLTSPKFWRGALPALSLTVVLLGVFWLQPRAMSYFGLNLLFNLAVPIALATIAQMFVIAVNDLDLSIGSFVSLVACIGATWLRETPLLGLAALAGCIVVYAGIGALIHLRQLPSIVVTLGMSFVWSGCAVLLLPTPGGTTPDWIRAMVTFKPPYIPFPIVASVLIAGVVYFGLMRTSWGAVLRGVGGNEKAMARAGWSILKLKMVMYSLTALFGIFAGLTLVGLTTSADANIALRYTLLSIAGVILGGGEFVGGRVSPVGAVLGAMTLTLTASFLSFLRISPDWQIGAQGAILIIVLALRAIVNRLEARKLGGL